MAERGSGRVFCAQGWLVMVIYGVLGGEWGHMDVFVECLCSVCAILGPAGVRVRLILGSERGKSR